MPKELTSGVWAAMFSDGTRTLQFFDEGENSRLKQWVLLENYSSSCNSHFTFYTEGTVEFKEDAFTFMPKISEVTFDPNDCPNAEKKSYPGNLEVKVYYWNLAEENNEILLYVYDPEDDHGIAFENIETPAQFPIPVPAELVATRTIQKPFTTILTSVVPISLVLGALLALLISFWLLNRYRTAVRKTMYTSAEEEAGKGALINAEVGKNNEAGTFVTVKDLNTAEGPRAETLLKRLVKGPMNFAAIHFLAGAAYAVLFSMIDLSSKGFLELLPVRLVTHFLIFLWPVIILLVLIIRKRNTGFLLFGSYFVLYILLGLIAVSNSPLLTWTQFFYIWGLNNFIPTILLLAFLNKRVRAIGPLVFTVATLAVLGSFSFFIVGGIDPKITGSIAEVLFRWGIPVYAVIILFYLLGFFIFGILGWAILVFIKNRYKKKKLSDQAIISGSVWFVFALSYSTGTIFSGIDWLLISLLPIFIYFIIVKIGYILAARRQREAPATNLLFLRSFSLEKRSRQLFDIISRHWRFAGSIQLISGPDLAESTIQPHEFLDFMSGKLTRRFIKNSADLEVRLQEMDTRPDNDSLYRINDFFCYDNIWKRVLSSLVGLSDAVVMDLREFTRERKGCEYEIRELLQVYPIPKTIFIVDETTDLVFLKQTLKETREELLPTSPNKGLTADDIRLFELKDLSDTTIDRLLRVLFTAAGRGIR